MQTKYFGVDVSKDTLDIACGKKAEWIENNRKSIMDYLKKIPAGSVFGMEATNTYHLAMADACHAMGMRVYVVNPRATRHYREALHLRGHNDRLDAKTLASYVEHHHEGLREYSPKPADAARLKRLNSRRNKLVGVKTQLVQSLGDVKELGRDLDRMIKHLDALIEKVSMLIEKLLENNEDRKRLMGITGIGPVASAVLLADLDAGEFRKADAFVAFYGLDPVPDDSGKRRGKRKISKKGDRLGRCVLYNAAMSASKSIVWKPVYERYLANGLSKVEAIVCLARRLAKVAWSVYKHKTDFNPARISQALT